MVKRFEGGGVEDRCRQPSMSYSSSSNRRTGGQQSAGIRRARSGGRRRRSSAGRHSHWHGAAPPGGSWRPSRRDPRATGRHGRCTASVGAARRRPPTTCGRRARCGSVGSSLIRAMSTRTRISVAASPACRTGISPMATLPMRSMAIARAVGPSSPRSCAAAARAATVTFTASLVARVAARLISALALVMPRRASWRCPLVAAREGAQPAAAVEAGDDGAVVVHVGHSLAVAP